jgi:hypothetical protein
VTVAQVAAICSGKAQDSIGPSAAQLMRRAARCCAASALAAAGMERRVNWPAW